MYNIRQSENSNQWFVEVKEDNKNKIFKVFYSEDRCKEYIVIAELADNASKTIL